MIVLSAAQAGAAPTQDEVFRSINQNVGSNVDLSKIVPIVLMTVAVVIMLVLYTKRRQRAVAPKAVNHPGKLLKEVSRQLGLRAAEINQLKILAEDQAVESPLTLLLCPSVLARGIREKNPKVDRKVVQQIVQKLRGQGSAAGKPPPREGE